MSLSVLIPQFEGPLGLLLYLIRKEEMDIFDINIHLITSQYLDYIKKMKQFDLEVAGDFIAMAATLIQIKSKMLLPNYNEEGEEEEVEDPRKELVRRLVEYQRYQEASKKLYDRPLLGRDVFKKGGKTASFHSDEDGEIILDEGGLFSLIGLYRGAVRKMKKAIHRVGRKSRSIAARILEIKDKFVVGQKVILRELIDSVEEARGELLITFLSALELGKMGFVSVYQSEIYGDIYLTAKKPITGAVVSRVEEYDSQGAEDLADTLMEQAAEDQEEMAMMEDQEPVEEEVVEPTMNFEMTQQEFTETQQEMTSQEGSSDESEEFVAIASDSDIEEAEQELNIDMNENTEEMIVEDNLQADRDGELT